MPRYPKPKIGRPKGSKNKGEPKPSKAKVLHKVGLALSEETVLGIARLMHAWGTNKSHTIDKAVAQALESLEEALPSDSTEGE